MFVKFDVNKFLNLKSMSGSYFNIIFELLQNHLDIEENNSKRFGILYIDKKVKNSVLDSINTESKIVENIETLFNVNKASKRFESTFNKCINFLVSNNVIIKKNKNQYIINPEYILCDNCSSSEEICETNKLVQGAQNEIQDNIMNLDMDSLEEALDGLFLEEEEVDLEDIM